MKQLFLNAIAENPTEDEPKLIYADWLEEQGDFEAEAWRWIVDMGIFPVTGYFLRGYIPDKLFWLLHDDDTHNGRDINTQIEAYCDLVRVYIKARKDEWVP